MLEEKLVGIIQLKPKTPLRTFSIVMTFFIFVAALFGCILFTHAGVSSYQANSLAQSPFLRAQKRCGTCTPITEMEARCSSCVFNPSQRTSISCPAGYGNIKLNQVKVGQNPDAQALVALQKECMSQSALFNVYNSNFQCTFTLSTLTQQPFPMNMMPMMPVDFDAESESEPFLSRAQIPHATTEYTCYKRHTSPRSVRSMTNGFARLQSSLQKKMLLSVSNNGLLECNHGKSLASTVELLKICQVDPERKATFKCNKGPAPRVIVVTVAQRFPDFMDDPMQSQEAHGKNLQRAKMITDYCASNIGADGICILGAEALLVDQETVPDIMGFQWDIKFMCSYANTMGLTLKQTAPVKESTSEKVLSSGIDGASKQELKLRSARKIECGSRIRWAQTVELGKQCVQDNFVLQCNGGPDPRLIIVQVGSNNVSPGTEEYFREKEKGKNRGSLATNHCSKVANFQNGACQFGLEDILLNGEKVTDFASSIFTVKYLCSYADPSQAGLSAA